MGITRIPQALLHSLTSPHDGHLGKQILFFVYVLTFSALLGIVQPTVMLGLEYLLGLAAIAALTVLTSLAYPRVSSTHLAWILLPVADVLAVAPLRDAFRVEAGTVTLLAFVPALWAAYCWRYLGAALATAAVTLAFAVPTLLREYPEIDGTLIVRTLIILLVVLQVTLLVAMATSRAARERARTAEALRERTDLLCRTADQEQLLTNVIDSLSVGIVVVDKDGHDVLMNSAQQQLHALALPVGDPDPSEDRLEVRYPESSIPIPPRARPVRRAVERETFTNYLVSLGPLDGPRRTLSTAARQIVDVRGERDGAVILFSDVSDFVEVAKRQRQSTADVSHEMRTPLTSILGYLDLTMEAEELPSTAREHLEVAERNAEKLLQYVEDLLEGLSVSPDEDSVALVPARLGDLARETCETLRPRAVEGEIDLRCTVETEASLLLDPPRMTQVLSNLVSNALKYTPAGGRVEVRVSEAPEALEVRVSDTGIGMAPEEQANLFMEYYRTTAVREGRIPGYGLGLSITQRIVRAHGGQISVRSAQGEGSTFTVRLPRERLLAPRR
ncbi:PAS domain-containing protein [Brachybacterium sp. MASK1Z-5]|uniref:histidine kinase n=1 Tax=Brachybacterium halotolerans TaxID=2795215 RepID=A0ABS1B7V0_9MICO|nr:PAS domain-containing sensor histidine kinase [Brachybacterium halotolerans]MBK0330737.1 PAS domain-containing protein [Brachybacterium halotolerans]